LRKLGVVALVAAGWVMIAQSIPRFAATVANVMLLFNRDQFGVGTSLVVSLLTAVALLGLGVFLILQRDRLAERWFVDSELRLSVDPLPAVRLGVVLVGLVLVATGIPALLGSVGSVLVDRILRQPGLYDPQLVALMWRDGMAALAGLVQIGVGVVLVGRSQSLAQIAWGQARPQQDRDDEAYVCEACGEPYDPTDYAPENETWECANCRTPLPRTRA